MAKKLPNELKGAGDVVEDFNTRIIALEEKFGDNEKIAKTLCEVSEKQKDFDKIFEKTIEILIKNSPLVKNAIQGFIDSEDRNIFWKITKRFGVSIGWIVSLFVAGYVGYVLKKMGIM